MFPLNTSKLLSRAVVPNLFGARDQFCGRQFFHGPGWQGDGFGMIQAHYIYCALYFYYYYTVIYNEIIIQIIIMLTGGGAQAVMQAMGSSYKYRRSFPCSPAAHFMLCGSVPNRPPTGTSSWPRGWGPLI